MRCRRVIRFRVHVASLSDKSCASRFAASSVKRLFGRRQVVIVQVGSLVVSHDCGFVGSVVCLVARVSKKLRRCEVRPITTGRMTRRNPCFVLGHARSFLLSMLLFTAAKGAPAAVASGSAQKRDNTIIAGSSDRVVHVGLKLESRNLDLDWTGQSQQNAKLLLHALVLRPSQTRLSHDMAAFQSCRTI